MTTKRKISSIYQGTSLSLVVATLSVQAASAVPVYGCGEDDVETSVDFLCRGVGNPIADMIGGIISWLATGVGLVITLMIVVGGFQYITAGGNPEKVQHAKKRITEAVEALILFIFMVAILNFVIPGGIIPV